MSEKQDPLAHAIEAVVKITPSGVRLMVQSRIASALEYLGANKLRVKGLPDVAAIAEFERDQERQETLSQAYTNALAEQINSSPELVGRMLVRRFKNGAREQENLEALLYEAANDLLLHPPTQEQAAVGPDHLSDDFLSRIEVHAERASTDEMRKKWASVLAGEIRAPGTFSPMTLRIIDEIEPDVARSFNNFAEDHLGGAIPFCLTTYRTINSVRDFEAMGLVAPSGFADSAQFHEISNYAAVPIHAFGGGGYLFGVLIEDVRKASDHVAEVVGAHESQEKVWITAYTLTRAGKSLASLVGDVEKNNTARLARLFRQVLGPNHVQTFHVDQGNGALSPADLSEEVRKLDVWP